MISCKPAADSDTDVLTSQVNTVSDIDNNVYSTVTIGDQIWMVENLKTTKFKNGTAIPLLTDKKKWETHTTSAYCWYGNDVKNKNIYGALYNGFAVNTNNLCPSGWHVPSLYDMRTLFLFVRNYYYWADRPEDIAGGLLKEPGTSHWSSVDSHFPNEANTFGYNALPGGFRSSDDMWMNTHGFWWLSSAPNAPTFRDYYSFTVSFKVNLGESRNFNGYSVRCLKN